MRTLTSFGALALLLSLALIGCRPPAEPPTGTVPAKTAEPDEEAGIRAERAKLSPEDQKLVDAQDVCPIQDERLGAMGPPVKVTVKDKDGKEQPVFVCCKGCVKSVKDDPEKALKKVEELKTKRAEELEIQAERAKLSPEDRKLVDEQDFCPVGERLGSMGPPVKVMLKDKDGKEHPVFVCCRGCIKDIQKDPEKTLKKVEELKSRKKDKEKEPAPKP